MSGELNFGQEKHRAFIDKIVNDEGVRAEFERDPVKVLQEHGIGFDAADKPKPGRLLDTETLRARRDQLAKEMDEAGGHGSNMEEWHSGD